MGYTAPMPTQRFALAPDGPKRLRLTWSGSLKDFTVFVDEKSVAQLSPDDVKAGRDVALPEGTLHVQFKPQFAGSALRLTLNGQPVPGAANHPGTAVDQATFVLYFVAALNAVFGVVALFGHFSVLDSMGFGVGSVVVGGLYAVAGFFTSKRSQLALLAGTLLYVLDGVGGLVWSVSQGARPGIGGIFVRVVITVALFRGIKAIRELKAKPASA